MYVYDSLYLTHFPKSEDRVGAYKHEYAKHLADRYGKDNYLEGYRAVSEDAAELFCELAEEQVAEYKDGLEENEKYPECLWEAEVLFHLASSLYDLEGMSFKEEETWSRWLEVKEEYIG